MGFISLHGLLRERGRKTFYTLVCIHFDCALVSSELLPWKEIEKVPGRGVRTMSRSGPKDVTSSSTVEEEGSKTKLERENRMLKEQIVQLHSSLESYRRALHQHHAQTKAQERGEQGDSTQNKEERDVDDLDRVTLSTGEEVFIKPEELAAIRAGK